jgi:hypothetical protein
MTLFSKAIGIFGFVVSTQAADPMKGTKAGLTVGIDHEFIPYVSDMIIPDVISAINGIEIANFTSGATTLYDFKVQIDQSATGQDEGFDIAFNPKDQSLDLSITKVTGKISLGIDYDGGSWVGHFIGSGEVDLEKSGASLTTQILLKTEQTDDKKHIVPSLDMQNFNFALPLADFELKAKVIGLPLDSIIKTLTPELQKIIVDSANTQVPELYNPMINTFMKANGAQVPLFADQTLDLSFSAPAKITAEHIQGFMNFQFYNDKEKFPAVLPEMVANYTTKEAIQAGVTAAPFNYLLDWAMEIVELADILDTGVMTYEQVAILDTNDMELFFPGVIDRYGLAQKMTMQAKAFQAPVLHFVEGGIDAQLFFDVELWGINKKTQKEETAIKLRVKQAELSLDLKVLDFNLTGGLHTLAIKEVDTTTTNIGPQDESAFIAFIDDTFNQYLPQINSLFNGGLEIPHTLGELAFKDFSLEARTDYIYFLGMFDFSKPKPTKLPSFKVPKSPVEVQKLIRL